MQDYLVISLLDESEEKAKSVLAFLSSLFRKRGTRIVLIADGQTIDDMAFSERKPLPFTAFTSGIDSLEESVSKEESLIFYDTAGEDVFKKTLEVMLNTSLNTVLTVGDDRKGMKSWIHEDSRNVVRTLSITNEGDRLFIYPPSLGITRENVIDTLIQIDSMTRSGYFDKDKPFALIRDGNDNIRYDEILVIAEHIGMAIEIVDKDTLPRLADYDAILAFSNPGYSISLTFSFGLPFSYMNAPGMVAPALYRALDAHKNLS